MVNDHTSRQPIARTDESRERRTRQERPGHQHRKLAAAVPVTGGDGHRHDPKRGEIVGQLDRCRADPVTVGHHRRQEKRGGPEPRAKNLVPARTAAAPGIPALVAGGHLGRHVRHVAGELQAEAARLIEQVDRIGSPVPGERQHTLIHRPERHFAPHAPARVLHRCRNHGLFGRAILGLCGGERHGQALFLGCHPHFGVADPDGGPAGVVERTRLGAPAPGHHDRDERVRTPRLGDGKFEGGGPIGDGDPALVDHAFPLDSDPRLGVGEWRGEQHRGGVAHLVAALVGDDVHLELRFVGPGHPARTGDPAIETGRDVTALGIAGPEGDGVAPRGLGGQPAAGRSRGSPDLTAVHRVLDPLAHQFGEPVALPADLMPFPPDQVAPHRHVRHPVAVGPDRDHVDRLGASRGPEVGGRRRLGSDVEGRRMNHNRGGPEDRLPVDVGDHRLDADPGRQGRLGQD